MPSERCATREANQCQELASAMSHRPMINKALGLLNLGCLKSPVEIEL